MYLRIVLRSTPRLCDISLSDLPACQCTSISVTSITSNVLLAIGPPSQTGGKTAPSRWPGPPRHAPRPHGELRDRGEELRDRQPLRAGELQDRRHAVLRGARKPRELSVHHFLTAACWCSALADEQVNLGPQLAQDRLLS